MIIIAWGMDYFADVYTLLYTLVSSSDYLAFQIYTNKVK